ncbi:hypothetical protein R1flu_006671 [Riccia fluitans]|uniref:Clp R domain-containing protein n=1 Tax=Riccia fluitans TaxID=41844 RepID=A0ABD1YWN2_9MARC
MRAGVGAIAHTLTPAANAVLKDALAEAKTRGHSQVQPLHVAALLLIQSDSDSTLRRACLESHKDPSHPLQCRALELCFKVALDRLPSNQEKASMPQLSNALVAALKRAQAHQRRGTPEQSLQPLLAVKVEIDQLIISILDDPSVSRVMREAGFSSTDVKSNMEDAAAAAQQCASLTCVTASLDTSGQLRRGAGLPVAPFCGSPLDNGHFRHSLFSSGSPLMLESPGSNLRMGQRGLLPNVADAKTENESSLLSPFLRQDAGGRSSTPVSPFAEKSPRFLNRMEPSRLHPQLPVSLNRGVARSTGYEEDVRNVVETLSKKKNAVVLNDVGSHSSGVVKEFSQRLNSGDVPSFLKSVHFVNLPFSSLTVGLFSHEEMEQKLTLLRNTVEGSMAQGVILSLGDLEWLAESVQGKATVTDAHALLVIRELTQFLDVYSNQRFWLLATASPDTFISCKLGDPPLESRLNLQSVPVAAIGGLGFQSRHSGHQIKPGGRPTALDHIEAATPPLMKTKLPGMENSVDGLECCPECTGKYQSELSRLVKQDRAPNAGLGVSPASTSSWRSQSGDKNWPPLAVVKDEGVLPYNPLLSQRIRTLRENWQRVCAAHSADSGGLLTTADPVRSFHSSTQAIPENLLSQGKGRPLMSIPRWPEAPRFLVPSAAEQPSTLPSKVGNLPPWAVNPSPVSSLSNGEATSAYRSPDVPSVPVPGWMKRTETNGDLDSGKLSPAPVLVSRANRNTLGVDLALGRSSVELASRPTRDLKEEGQQPLQGEMKLSAIGNSWNESAPEVTLPWRVPSLSGTDFLKGSVQKRPAGNVFRPNDMDSLKGLWRGLQDMVPWQRDASSAVATTVADCRSGHGRKRGSATKTDSWFLFLGPDRVGKKEVAKALAKLVFGDEKKFIWMQLGGKELDAIPFGSGVRQRGKTFLDRLAEAVRLKPFSVVFLEDVDQADVVVRGSLQRAMERGRLPSSNGREVSFANVIVIMTCSVGGSSSSMFDEQDNLLFQEEQLSVLPSYGMKLKVDESKCGRVLQDNGSGVSVVSYGLDLRISLERSSSSPTNSGKRRAHWALESGANDSPLVEKRLKKEGSVPCKALALDLNLSAEENECLDDLSCTTDSNTSDRSPHQESEETMAKKIMSLARESLPKEIFEMADARVIFRPFDFATLTEGVLEQIETAFRTALNPGISMEVDVAVLEQLVSAAWQTNSDRKTFESWVNDVLVKTLSSLSVDCGGPRTTSVVKLMVDPGQALEVVQDTAVVRVGLLPGSIKCL